jgi:hypothetical protein
MLLIAPIALNTVKAGYMTNNPHSIPPITTKKEAKSKNGIFKNSGRLSVNFTTPTVSAEPVNSTKRDTKNPMNEENVNFISLIV